MQAADDAQAAGASDSGTPGAVGQHAPQRKFRRVYTVSFAHTTMSLARKPCDFTREEFALLLRKYHDEVFTLSARGAAQPNTVDKIMVFKELHADQQQHIYAIVMASRPYGPEPVRQRMRTAAKVHTSFGASHAFFWSAVVYGSVPSVHKAPQEMDPNPYHSLGLTLREELADFPKGARQCDKDRVRSHLGLPGGDGRTRPAATFSKPDFADLVRTEGWRTQQDVMVAARTQRPVDPTLYNTMLHMGQKDLTSFLEWVWEMERAGQEIEGDRMAKLRSTAREGQCICAGKWKGAASRLMDIQGIDSVVFRAAVLRALKLGRKKTVNILILGEPDAGKSFLLKVLPEIFKAFVASGQSETFPLQGLHGSEICVLQDVRYESFGLAWDEWLRWGEGEAVKVRLPRNHFQESRVYTGTAPLFASMASPFRYPLGEARKFGRDVEYENKQFRSRWTTFTFGVSIPEAERDPTIQACAMCGAQWYLEAEPIEAFVEAGGDAGESPAAAEGAVSARALGSGDMALPIVADEDQSVEPCAGSGAAGGGSPVAKRPRAGA